jgi:hypothetical protein
MMGYVILVLDILDHIHGLAIFWEDQKLPVIVKIVVMLELQLG